MKEKIETSIIINAPHWQVMSFLTDTKNYSSWNPFIKEVRGEFLLGHKIYITVTPPGGGRFKFRPVVLNSDAYEIRWKGKVFFTGLFDADHLLKLRPISENVTEFIHIEDFSGFLVPFMKSSLEKTRKGFEEMNHALKNAVESKMVINESI